MNRRALLALPAAALLPTAARAQAWPSGPVRAIVPFAPGSATDTVGRLLAEGMRERSASPWWWRTAPARTG
jgi:tripartite-type tricarboxylate transporter receptor subunit TctC